MFSLIQDAYKEMRQETIDFYYKYRCQMCSLWFILISLSLGAILPLSFFKIVGIDDDDYVYYQIILLRKYLFWSLGWFFLGILASIGFGTGLQTGVLFLFPWIVEVIYQANECGHTNFDLLGDNQFQCQEVLQDDTQFSNTTLNLFCKCYPTVFLWGVGTAFGEIPPFWISRASQSTTGVEELYREYPKSKWMLRWINDRLQSHAFLIIFLMASYPNVLFDMCGMMSGFAGISFWTFLLATILGKACVKSSLQLLFIIVVSSGKHKWIENVVPESLKWVQENITTIQDYSPIETHGIGFKQVWMLISGVMTIGFILSCIRGKANAWRERTKFKTQ